MKQDEDERRNGAAEERPSPQEFQNFADLTRKLLGVPKAELDEKIERWKRGRQKRRPS